MTGSAPDTAGDAAPAAHWRVLTWNVRGRLRPDGDALAEVITRFAPDVVSVQEIQAGQARRLAGTLGWRHHWARKHYPFTPLVWWRAEGLAILTPHDLVEIASASISPGTSTWTYRHCVVLAGTVRRGKDDLRVFAAHLAAHDRADERIAQARRIADRMRADAPAAPVVAGDLNAHDEVEVIRELRRGGVDDPGGGPTHPSTAPNRRLDYVLIPTGAGAVDEHRPDGGDEWFELSDHLPVLVSFTR